MKRILNLLRQSKICQEKIVSGVKEGEKALIVGALGRGIILSSDFVEAIKMKKNLTALGRKCEIISAGREVGIKNDQNLKPFASAISGFVSGALDNLIFLPNSMVTKFDLSLFFKPLLIDKKTVVSPQKLAEKLTEYGYKRTSLVSMEGEFALRGDIFDIFLSGSELPIRLDFFDDQIENITYFSLSDMKSVGKLEKATIYPISLPVGKNVVSDIAELVICDQIERVESQMGLILKSYEPMSGFSFEDYATFQELKFDMAFALSGGENIGSGAEINYVQNFAELKEDLKVFDAQSKKMILFCGDERSKKRIKDFLLGAQIAFSDYDNSPFYENGIYLSQIYYPNSFSFPSFGIYAIGSDNLTHQKANISGKSKKDAFYQPKIGEYVVHEFHGIGKCVGVERMKLADFEKDYFVIEYSGGGMLYLPSEQAGSLSAYVGQEEPKMNKLGGHEFEILKSKVKKNLEEFALKLMQQYKQREQAKGIKFASEEFLENAFASSFEFEETIDQAVAIKEVLSDMEEGKVMDRLLCGDVGFGKTEVGYRAAFRAIINSKQVALLCPTTILSEQHYLAAVKRMRNFGVRIAVLNRFKKPSETKEICQKLKNGEIDFIIGTHKLLAKGVEFKDLGLLIVDEEQRFGVADKEKIKALKQNLDVLALSATPIPRTLHMSLSGIRDISVIATPPRDRLPIQTYVTNEDDEIISSVIRREIARNGQTFIIYNRVQTIMNVAAHIHALVPEANIGVAHGQMSEKELERVIDRLFKGEYNVFLSTTLIENGIDLPSANSMIIFDADLLGLSQLYQLRGRIGRSDKLSYAYLFYKTGKSLTDEAYKRLEAIQQFRDLGSGFKISMRDLEIRGAGNVFGREQHGHIEKVGYDMYVRLLNETIDELKGQKTKEHKPIKIDLPVDAFIPEDYISSDDDRIGYYVKISGCLTSDEMQSMLQSFLEGFGQPPQSVVNLLKIALIKNLAEEFDVKSIRFDGDVKIELYKSQDVADARLIGVLNRYNASLKFDSLPTIRMSKEVSWGKMLDRLICFFEDAKNEKIEKHA